VFKDQLGKTWTAYADAKISTAQKKFGTASGYFDGTGDYIATPDYTGFDFGTGALSIAFWVRSAKATWGTGALFSLGSSGNRIAIYPPWYVIHAGATTYSSGVLYLPTYDTWEYIALVRESAGTTIKVYANGSLTDTISIGSNAINVTSASWIGKAESVYGQCYIDEFVVWKEAINPAIIPTSEYSYGPDNAVAGWNPSDSGNFVTVDSTTWLTATHA